jgi:hypothetical protein
VLQAKKRQHPLTASLFAVILKGYKPYGKGGELMRRTILMLTAAALMVVLVATTVSPAFAQNWWSGYWGYGSDGDKDGFKRTDDNCPYDYNPDQTDTDQDGYGNACDAYDDDPTKH